MKENYSLAIVSIIGVNSSLLQQHTLPLTKSVEQLKQPEKKCQIE